MDFSSLHVCMESSDHWLQGTMNEESSGKDSSSLSSPCGGDMLACSRPTMAAERRLRPPHDQALKCPRCDSAHTKFCYYNNYSLSQPRYFCKTCRRYWTKGGTLRNIPVGGGCRKNKKVSSKKQNEPTLPSSTIATNITHHQNNQPHPIASFHHHNPKDLQLSFPADMQFSHFNNLLGSPNFMESKYNLGILDNNNHRPIDFMETSTILRNHNHNSRNNNNNFDFFEINSSEMGVGGMNVLGGDMSGSLAASNYQNLCTFGGNSNMSSLNGNYNNLMESSCQRLMLPYDHHHATDSSSMDIKPNPKLLALEWQEQGCSDAGKDSFGYLNGSGSWNGVINGYGSSSTTNPLV